MKNAPAQADDKSGDAVPVLAVDPLQRLCDTLISASSGDDKAVARQTVSAMERPWEQLPSRLKSAARSDAAAILATSGSIADLRSAGYGARIAEQLTRDLGCRG